MACCPSYSWIPASDGQVPANAVVAGKDSNGGLIYAGKAVHENEVLPCKVVPSLGKAYVAHGGAEHTKSTYEVLCGSGVVWQYSSNGQVPKRAIVAGRTGSGEKLYIGRALHGNSLTPGRVHPSKGLLYIPYHHAEHSYKEYDVAVEI